VGGRGLVVSPVMACSPTTEKESHSAYSQFYISPINSIIANNAVFSTGYARSFGTKKPPKLPCFVVASDEQKGIKNPDRKAECPDPVKQELARFLLGSYARRRRGHSPGAEKRQKRR